MKITVNEDMQLSDTEIIINCPHLDPGLNRLVEMIRRYTFSLEVRKDTAIYQLPLDSILYLETVDRTTFVYGSQSTYTCRQSLGELEQKLSHTSFVRISRTCLLNILHLTCVRPYVNHRVLAVMDNGENLLISRSFIPILREKLHQFSPDGTAPY